MDNISLIKNIEDKDNLGAIFPVTFDMGKYIDKKDVKSIFNLIKDKGLLAKDGISLSSNSFTVPVKLDAIPKITSILVENHIKFYGIYVLYGQYLEMREVDKNEW